MLLFSYALKDDDIIGFYYYNFIDLLILLFISDALVLLIGFILFYY
jgi:hypothetical protein